MGKDGVPGALNRTGEQPRLDEVSVFDMNASVSVCHAARCNDKDASAPFEVFRGRKRGGFSVKSTGCVKRERARWKAWERVNGSYCFFFFSFTEMFIRC